MRVLSVGLIAVMSCALVTADSTKSDVATVQSAVEFIPHVEVAHNQVERTLRQYIPVDFDSNGEERGVVDKVDDVVTKVDDVTGITKFDDATGKTKKLTPKLDAFILKNLDEFSEQSALAKKLASKYEGAAHLSLPTLRQLDEIEKLRATDIVTYSKRDGKSMHREIPDFPGKKTVPEKFLESHVGRAEQRYGPGDSRLLANAVVYDPTTGRVLLISSSNPNKNDFLLVKGGWDKGEDVETATLREVMEEGGVSAGLMHNLGETKFSEGDKNYVYYSYLVKSKIVYDDWAESVRYRIWVSFNDAIVMVANREHMVKVLKEAKEIARKIKTGELDEVDSKLSKFTLDLD